MTTPIVAFATALIANVANLLLWRRGRRWKPISRIQEMAIDHAATAPTGDR